jgi:hypothetical protein
MKTLSPDTNEEIERFHIGLIRKASVQKRLEMINSLIRTTRRLSWMGICERYPECSLDERIERFILLLYEDKLMAERVMEQLADKKYPHQNQIPLK